jgi:murein DD-endopeptidase MepM/ murein hydrolase activator NlpD
MQDKIKDLENLKSDLENNKRQTEKKKLELIALQNDLKDQAKIIAETVKEKNSILTETKNTEANYKKILASRKSQKELFEKEILEYESALKIAIDPNSIPRTGSGVLMWPLDKIRISQYFGNTEFASKNPQAYSGKGHNGIDLAIPIGTPVKSSLTGVIVGSGNMDLAGGGRCRSYGKWIMVKHPNGLSTLYGHLSLIKVNNNQTVGTGEIIGYSGSTGYSTGPHLHFSVYATEGVRITRLTNSINCKDALAPLADLKAYLNPLSYLPY